MRRVRDEPKSYRSPTASDRNAQIVKLTRQNIRIMRLLLNDLAGEE